VAHQRFPQNPEVLFWYGNFLAAHQQGDQAAYAYQLALNQKQDVPGLRSALAEICVDKTRYGDAVRLAAEEIKRHPEVLLARKAMGLAYFGMRQKAEAVAPLTVAFEKLPSSSEVSNALAQSLIYCGKWDQALLPALVFLHRTSLDQVVDPKAKAMAVKIIQKCSPPVVAGIPELARTVDRRAGSATFHFNLADVLDKAGQYDLAISEYESGLHINPHFARGLFRLGCDLEVYKQDYKDALQLMALAHSLAPDDREIAFRFERLRMRLQTRNNDLAWELKDWLRGKPQQ
jgi:tetratricopeptide (TPR) repeat protein